MQSIEFDLSELRAMARSLGTSYDVQLRKLDSVERGSRVWNDTYELHQATDRALGKVQDAISVAVVGTEDIAERVFR